jgi:hypothetical protein
LCFVRVSEVGEGGYVWWGLADPLAGDVFIVYFVWLKNGPDSSLRLLFVDVVLLVEKV